MDNNDGHDSSRDFLYLAGGVALMVLCSTARNESLHSRADKAAC
jgi:hypothetical protein